MSYPVTIALCAAPNRPSFRAALLLDPMRWLSFVPGKATLVLLFNAAKRRMTEHAEDVAELPDARIESATEELNKIADDLRDARGAPEESPLAIQHLMRANASGEVRHLRKK